MAVSAQCHRSSIACCVLSVILCSLSVPASAQVLSGHILEVDSERPIAAALVTVLDAGQAVRSAESDSAGAFRLALGRAGTYGIRVERIGYAPITSEEFTIASGETLEIIIRLSVRAVSLAPLTVIDRRGASMTAGDFRRRMQAGRRSGLGQFVTREQLDSTRSLSVTAVLARVPQVGMSYDSRRGKAMPMMLSRGGCRPTLYLNGAPWMLAPGEFIDDVLDPAWIEGIEVYRTRNELPPDLAGPQDCGAIVFWTREPARSSGGLWRYIVGGGIVLGIVVIFLAK